MTGYNYRAEVDTSLGLRVVRTDHDGQWPPEAVFNLTPAPVETNLTDLFNHHEANLEGAGWQLAKGGQGWGFFGRGPTNGMVYAADVERIEQDGQYCGCPPGEHKHNHKPGPEDEYAKGTTILKKFTVYTWDSPEGRQGFVEHDSSIVCDGCEKVVSTFASVWVQGTRGVLAAEPDTVVVYECLECLLLYPNNVKIEFED